jgi:hypothetical protein
MNHHRDSGDVDQSMQPLPSPAAQAANPALGRSDGQWNHADIAGEPGDNEAALGKIAEDFVHVETLVYGEPGGEVQ